MLIDVRLSRVVELACKGRGPRLSSLVHIRYERLSGFRKCCPGLEGLLGFFLCTRLVPGGFVDIFNDEVRDFWC